MPVFNLIEYSDNYGKTSDGLQQHGRDEPDNNIPDPESFIFKSRLTNDNDTGNAGSVNVEIAVPLKDLHEFLKALEMPLKKCKITLDFNLVSKLGHLGKRKSNNIHNK